MQLAREHLSGKHVLVTGGTGGIGGRLVERLVLECGANVAVLVRNLKRAPRIARLPVELIHGDVTKLEDVERSVRQGDIVFHCAYGNTGNAKQQRITNVEGTRNVMEACLRAGVEHIVHISTCRVYGVITPDGDLDETAARRYSNNPYTDSKLDAEYIVFQYVRRHGLPVVVIQPTTVYGPFVPVWTLKVIERLKTGQTILVNAGEGTCNAVYVDDVVSAILLAAVRKQAAGEAFLISGDHPVTWRQFYERFNRMVGGVGTVNMSMTEANACYVEKRRQRKPKGVLKELVLILRNNKDIRKRIRMTSEVAALVKIVKFILPEKSQRWLGNRYKKRNTSDSMTAASQVKIPIHALTPQEIRYFAAKTRFRIDKARRLLGYQPAFDFDRGMQITEAWARWSNLAHNR